MRISNLILMPLLPPREVKFWTMSSCPHPHPHPFSVVSRKSQVFFNPATSLGILAERMTL